MKVNASSWQHLKTHSVKACIYWPLSKQTVDLDKLSSEFFSLCCSIGSFTKSTSCCTHYNMFKPQRGELRCVEMNRASPAWCIHSSQVLFFKQVSKDRLHSPRGLCNACLLKGDWEKYLYQRHYPSILPGNLTNDVSGDLEDWHASWNLWGEMEKSFCYVVHTSVCKPSSLHQTTSLVLASLDN